MAKGVAWVKGELFLCMAAAITIPGLHYQSYSIDSNHIRSFWEGCTEPGFAIVVDIGKTLGKVSLWSRGGALLDRQVRRNEAVEDNGLRRLDARGIAEWLTGALAKYRGEPVGAIVPVAHGAGVAVLTGGELAFAPLDYEQPIPDDLRQAYEAERDPFTLTGSPFLPGGLNLGAQLYWLERLYPQAMERAVLLPWAQYWTWWLSGRAVSEVTSLGCHSDLWAPALGTFSPMAVRLGWAERFAPLSRAGEPAGPLRPALAEATGLSAQSQVLAGLHDSNAALLAARGIGEIARREATILSTGTWFVAMRTPAEQVSHGALPEGRDCLVNVDADGRPVPSARFMGGREIETALGTEAPGLDSADSQPGLLAAAAEVLDARAMLLPTLAPGCGPFPHGKGQWRNRPEDPVARGAAACLYAALVADSALELIGTRNRLVVEGRFAGAEPFLRALAALRPELSIYASQAQADASFGAMRLIVPGLSPPGGLRRIEPLEGDIGAYARAWRKAAAQ
jgi:sugar (pentulose or hexulose) kinase